MMHISIDGKRKYIRQTGFLRQKYLFVEYPYLTVQFCNRNGGVYIIFTLFNPIRLNIPEFF